jgi:outer membrane immunogenic protein
MRLATTGTAAALLLASMAPAMAQSPPPLPPTRTMGAVDWSGFYIGANVGGAWGSETLTPSVPGATPIGNINIRGPFGGGTAGFNWQLSNGWLLGLEGDIDGAGIGGGRSCTNPAYNCRISNSWDGTVRGRVGWAPGSGNLLWFATGGAAFGDIRASIAQIGALPAGFGGAANGSSTNVGWTVGGGAEYMFAPQWSVKIEYRHTDLGSMSFHAAPTGPGRQRSALTTTRCSPA